MASLVQLALAFLLCAVAPCVFATDYHIDSRGGDDANEGTTPVTAWASLAPANTHVFQPGDRLLLRANSVWRGVALSPRGQGMPGRPILLGVYGEGARPILHGEGRVPAVISLFNQSHWEISGLEITNFSQAKEPPLSRGIEIRARDIGLVRHLVLRDLVIHDINGPPAAFSDSDVARKSVGAIGLIVEGDRTPTAWDGVLVENCHLHDVSYVGFANISPWTRGHRTNDPATWFPSRGIVIRGNLVERTARDGVIVRAAVAPLIEHNRFLECAREANGVGCFTFHCDGAVIQYNEAAYTRWNPGDVDATGFDSDWNCRDTVIQYNLSHHNDLGFLLLCNDGRAGFNERTIVRYNVSYADGGNVVRFAGPVTGARLYNNTFVLAPDMANPMPGEPPRVVYHKSWSGWSDDTLFANNVIVNHCPRAIYDCGASTANRYTHNLFFGHHPDSEPNDPHKVVADPHFAQPWPLALSRIDIAAALTPLGGSPIGGAGVIQPDQPLLDFAGRTMRIHGERVDLGAIATAATRGGESDTPPVR